MASGFGFQGGRSRCFTHWQEFQKCYSQADVPSDCIAQKEDYMECLHHTKELARMRTIRDTFLARQAKEAHQAREKGELRTTSSVLRLGIIGQQNDEGSGEDSGKSKGDGNGESSSDSSSGSGDNK